MFPKETYRLIIDSLSDYAVFTMDFSGKITSWNPGSESILGYTKEEVLGKPANLIFTDEDNRNGIFEAECKKALETGKSSDERWHVKKNGLHFWASGMMMSYKDEEGKVSGLVKILRDRTGQKESRKELERSNEDLEQFAFMIAHDFKSPLNMIDSYMTLLLRESDRLSPKARNFGKYIVEKINLLKRMVEKLLAYSKINQLETKFTNVSLNDACTQAVSSLMEEIKKKDAHIEWETMPQAWGDEVLLILVFQNLIGNSIKYCPHHPEIRITASQSPEGVIVSVKDNGIGIALEHKNKIFYPFIQLGNKESGHGLGLATVRKIVEFHGGKIWVESEPGQGSVFQFTLKKEQS